MDIDKIIETLGDDLVRELDAICWFCDSGPDGNYALFPASNVLRYKPGGEVSQLVETGCIQFMKRAHVETLGRRMPAVKMLQVGRRVLRRAKAIGIDLSPATLDGEAA